MVFGLLIGTIETASHLFRIKDIGRAPCLFTHSVDTCLIFHSILFSLSLDLTID
jgi:hypothetical protein